MSNPHDAGERPTQLLEMLLADTDCDALSDEDLEKLLAVRAGKRRGYLHLHRTTRCRPTSRA